MALSACYRMMGSFAPGLSVAVRYGGFALSLMLSSAGFLLPPPLQLGWAVWLKRIAPPAYALEALLANEFRTRDLTCSATDLIPNGVGYDNINYQACTIVGSTPGSATVNGLDYLTAKYGFSPSHIWVRRFPPFPPFPLLSLTDFVRPSQRNVGIMIAMYIIYSACVCSLFSLRYKLAHSLSLAISLVVIGTSLLVRDTGSASAKLYKRGAVISEKKDELAKVDSRGQHLHAEQTISQKAHNGDGEKLLVATSLPTFTFSDVHYTVQVGGKDKVLLDGVTAAVQPGKLMALMGASGCVTVLLLHRSSSSSDPLPHQRRQNHPSRDRFSAKDDRCRRRKLPH
jgi:ATP-binding cassette subfamily G (WHITE) protein 2 (SNQ2)